jgi:hypothetical protein
MNNQPCDNHHSDDIRPVGNDMNRKLLVFVLISATTLFFPWRTIAQPRSVQAENRQLQPPVLKWQHGGCFSSWCETGWYASPAVADIDGDGSPEVIASAYSIVALDGATGALEWRVKSGYDRTTNPDSVPNVGRTWPGIVIADLDGDSQLEIATAHGGGYVSVYTSAGYFEPGWPKRPSTVELRGLSVFDLDADGTMEIIVNAATDSKENTWVYEHNGTLRPGWPQLANDSGYAYGVFNDNTTVGDLDGDGRGEIVIPSDVHYLCAYEADGIQIPANPIYTDSQGNLKAWGKVGVWEDPGIEIQGWGDCSSDRPNRYRANFAHGAALISDLNRDGLMEVAAVGNMYDCAVGHPPGKYNALFIFHADRSRFNDGTHNWQTIPIDTGAPLSEDYNEIENNQPNPVVADLDGDGFLEILFSSYDGRVHAFWLDKTEHGNWPYTVDHHATDGFYRFASEPVAADLDSDGFAEIIFASWVEKGTYQTGKLHILNSLGNIIYEVDLPPAFGSPDWNGAMAAPTLANIDTDPDLEVILNTAHSGFVAYDLPGTANARPFWPTGRGNFLRNAFYLPLQKSNFLPVIFTD